MALTVESLLATAQLDDSGFTQGLDRITQGLEQYDRQAAALSSRPVALILDTSGIDAALQRPLAQLQRFTGAIEQVRQALPTLAVDPTTFAAGTEALERFVGLATRIPEIPSLSTREQVGEIQALEAALAGLAPTLAQIDPGGVLQATAANVRQSFAQLRADLAQQLTIAVDPTPAVAGFTTIGDAADALLDKLSLLRSEAARPLVPGGGGEVPLTSQPFDFTTLARGHEGALVAAQELREENQRLLEVMLQQGQAARDVSGDNAVAATAIGQMGERTAAAAEGFELASVGGSRLVNTLGNIAVSASGVSGPIATVASNLLVFVASNAKLVGAGAVVLGLKVAYDFLNTAQREVREENERLVQSLLQQADQALPAAERAQRGLVAALQQEEEAQRDLARLRGLGVVAPTIAQPFIGELARRQAQEAVDAQRALGQARKNAAEAGLEALTRNATILGQLLTLGEADIGQRRDALNLVKLLQTEEAKTNDLTKKLAIHQRILETQRALNLAVQQENAARAFTAERFSQRATELTAAPGLGTDTGASIRERQAEMARLTAIITSQTASLSERNAATRTFNELAVASLAPIQDQLQLLQTQRQSRITVDTGDAVRQLEALERRITAIGTATAAQRAQVIRLRAEIDLEQVEAQIAPLRQALEAAVSLRALRDAGEVELAESLGLPAAEAGVARLRVLVDQLLATATGAPREVLLQVRTQLAQGDRENLERQVQRVLSGAEASVRLTVDADPALAEIQRRFAVPFGIELDPTNALAQAQALAAEIARQIAAATGGGAITDAPAALQQQFAQLTAQIQALMEAPVNALIQGADRAGEQLDAALAAAEAQRALLAGPADVGAGIADIAARTALVAPLVAQIEAAYQRVTAQIEAGVASTAQLVALQQQQAALADRLAAQAADQRTPLEVTQLAPLEAATRAFVEAKQQFEVTGTRAAREAVDAAAAEMDRIRESLVSMIRALNLEGEVERRIIEAIEAAYRKAGRAAGDLSEANKEILRTLDAIGAISGALANAGGQLGIFSEDTQKAFRDIQAVAEDTASFIANIASGNVVGSIVGGLNLAGSIGGALGFGPSEEERLANQLRRENTQALREFTVRVTTGFEGAGGGADVAAIIARVLATTRGATLAEGTQEGGDTGRANRAALVALLEAGGLSFEQLQRVADEFGIEILSKGRLVGGALEQLVESIRAAEESLTHFGTSIGEREEVLRTRDRLGLGPTAGLPEEAQDLARQRELLLGGLDLGAAWEEQIQGLDLGTEQGRAAFLAFIQMLFTLAQAGDLTAEQLGAFESVTELLGPINGAIDALDGFNEATDAAADRLGALNVPTVLRLDALRAQASIPEWRQVDTLANLGAPDLTDLGQRATEAFGLGEESQSFETLASRLGDIAPLQEFLQRIATETPADLLSALETLGATIADRALPDGGLPDGAALFMGAGGEIIERRTDTIQRAPSVHIEYHGDVLIQVTAQPGQSPAEIAAAVRQEFERHAMNDTGQIQRAGETLGGP